MRGWLIPGGQRSQERWIILQNWLVKNNIKQNNEIIDVASFMDAPEMRTEIKKFLNYLKNEHMIE